MLRASPMEKITLTYAMIEAGISEHLGYSKAQLELLGVAWPPSRGWKTRVCSRPILRALYSEFLALKDVHLEK
jgi:hypothetical protein